MNLRQITYLVAIAFSLILFITIFVMEMKAFGRTGSKKYSFLRYFPFELNRYRRDSNWSYCYPIGVIAASLALSLASFSFALAVQGNGGAIIIAYIIAAISTITAIVFNIVTFVKLSNYLLHLIFAVVFLCLNLLNLVLQLFFFTNPNYSFVSLPNQASQITIFVFVFLLLILEAVLMFNPAYKRRNKMVKVDAETFNRPRFNYLAMLEWGNFFIYILSFVPIGILMFF